MLRSSQISAEADKMKRVTVMDLNFKIIVTYYKLSYHLSCSIHTKHML